MLIYADIPNKITNPLYTCNQVCMYKGTENSIRRIAKDKNVPNQLICSSKVL